MNECLLLYVLDQQVYYMNSSSFVYKIEERSNDLQCKPMSQLLVITLLLPLRTVSDM